jgi:hypothetical protein
LTTARSTLSTGVVKNVQEAEVETLIGLLAAGRAVNTGTVTYVPSADLDGNINVRVRVDKRILRALNAGGRFRGRFVNVENGGQEPGGAGRDVERRASRRSDRVEG